MRDAVRWAPRPWWEWEDHAAGLYGMPRGYAEQADARAVLANPALLLTAMRDAVKAWPLAAEHQLSHAAKNRRSWLGWAGCHLAVGATALATRAAWAQLADAQRAAANASADIVIAEWERAYLVPACAPAPCDHTRLGPERKEASRE